MALPTAGTINYVLQPSFETATPGYVGNNGNLSLTSSSFLYGGQALRWTCISTTGSTSPRVTSPGPGPETIAPMPAASVYNVSVWVKYSVTKSAQIQALTTGASPTGTLTVCNAGVWTRLSVSGTLPAAQTLMKYQIYTAGCNAGEIMDVDGVQVTVGATLWDYFDGAQTNCSWSGTPHNSYSTYLGVPVGPTPSAYMPDVKVEIAFPNGYADAAASRTWTDVSSYVELKQGINITHGRGDEFATTDPNKLSITLDNKDGRFTAGKTGSPYYPNVKIGRPIRVTSTPVGGTPSVRFLGYVDEWPTEWSDGTDAYAAAKITASSRMARLGFDAELRSTLEETLLASNPLAYYTMGDPEGSLTAAESSGYGRAPLAINSGSGFANPTFGTAIGPGFDDLTAASFPAADSRYMMADAGVSTTSALYIECFFSATGTPNAQVLLCGVEAGLDLSIEGTTGKLIVSQYVALSSAASVCDGLTHHAAFVANGTTLKLYLDGVEVASVPAPGTAFPLAIRVGQIRSIPFVPNIPITLAHVAFGGAITPADIANHAAAGLVGLSADTATQRIARYATFADIPAVEFVGDAGTNVVADIDTQGATVIDNMRKVEETEGGVLFDARDNTLILHGRARRYNAAVAFTLDVSLHEVEAGITPKLDRSALVNDVTATASDGSTARATNPTSITDYGYARSTVEIASSNDAALQAAYWQVNTYGDPQARIPSLGVDLLPLSQARQDSLFALDVSSRVRVSALPTQAPAATLEFYIEGYTEAINHESYTFDFNVSPAYGYDVFTLDDATKGVLDNAVYRLAL